jgi:steroid delta-isomerase-like uncharacterized protein
MTSILSQDVLATRLQLVEDHIRAENEHDVNGIMETFVPEPTFVLNGTTVNGHESIRGFYEEFGFGEKGGFANLHVETLQRHVSDEAIILELTLSGEHQNTWQGIPATGRKFEIPACAVFFFDKAGKLAGERVYLDGALLLKQLGVLP